MAGRIMAASFLSSKLIYEANQIYDEDRPEFNCYRPVESGKHLLLDCWVCDERGLLHPDYTGGGVPVRADFIGEPVADYEKDH